MTIDYEALGQRIHTRRKEMKLTQTVLAEKVGIEPSNISHIERAASKVGLGTLVSLANALNCSVDDLLGDSIVCERQAFENELMKTIADCTPLELRLITDMVVSLKYSMRKRRLDG